MFMFMCLFLALYSGVKMTGVSKTPLLISVVFARFLALTARFGS